MSDKSDAKSMLGMADEICEILTQGPQEQGVVVLATVLCLLTKFNPDAVEANAEMVKALALGFARGDFIAKAN